MTILMFSCALFSFSCIAGLIGALTGLGGGVVIIPVLVLFFHVNIHYAMGASMVSVLSTSSGAAFALSKEGFTNLRIGLFLETGAILGAFGGALLVNKVSPSLLQLLFSVVLFISAYLTVSHAENKTPTGPSHLWARRLKLQGSYSDHARLQSYEVKRVPLGLGVMSIAGLLSGLLGIGSGALKVLAMDQALRLPYKVSTSTSNFMIGMTAAMSVGVYFKQGFILPAIVFPVMVGVILGAYTGAKLLPILPQRLLRVLFSLVISFIGLQMFINGWQGYF